MEHVDITAPELINFLELFILPRRKESLPYDANDVLPEHFKITPCAACKEICQFDQNIDHGDGKYRSFYEWAEKSPVLFL